MAKKTMVDIAPILEKIKAYKQQMSDCGCSKSMLLGINGCLQLSTTDYTQQLELRKHEYQGMLNSMCKTYERIFVTTEMVNFGDFEAMILDHLVASNNFLATQIEELENCSPEDFKKMALVLAKKEL